MPGFISRLMQQLPTGGAPAPSSRGPLGRIAEMIRAEQARGSASAPNPQALARTAAPAMLGTPMTKPGMMKKGGVASASKRADGIAQRGKTKGRMV